MCSWTKDSGNNSAKVLHRVVLRSGNNSGGKSFRTKPFAPAAVSGCPNADFSLSYSAPAEITQEESRLELSR